MARIYRIETEYGTLHARRVDAQSFQHPSEVARGFTYEQCTPQGAVLNGTKMITGSTEDDILAAGGILVGDVEQVNAYLDAFKGPGRVQLGTFRHGAPTGGQVVRRAIDPEGKPLTGWTASISDDLCVDLPEKQITIRV